MKKRFLIAGLASILFACNSNSNKNSVNAEPSKNHDAHNQKK